MYFDTHAHYDDKRFDEDRDDLLNTMQEGGAALSIDRTSFLIDKEAKKRLLSARH